MADDVQITLGMDLSALTSGVESAKSSLESLKRGFESLAAVFGVSLGVEGIKSFIENMAALGLQAERIGAQLGVSNEQFVQLSGIARLAGSDINTMALGMERMTLNMQRSTRDGVNPAAQALQQLGINARSFTSMSVPQQFEALTNAVNKFNPSMNLTNALMLVGGRGVAQLVSTLALAGKDWNQWNDDIKKASVGLADAIPGMAETHVQLGLLETAVQSLGARIFNVLQPAIITIIDGMTNWVESITTEDIKTAVQTVGDLTLKIVKAIGDFTIEVIGFIRDLKAELESFFGPVSGWVDSIASKLNTANAAVKSYGEAWRKSMVEAEGGGAATGATVEPDAAAQAANKLAQQLQQDAEWVADAKERLAQNLFGIGEAVGIVQQKFNTFTVTDPLGRMVGQTDGYLNTLNTQFGTVTKSIGKDVDDFNASMNKFLGGLSGLKQNMGAIDFGAGTEMRDRLKIIELNFKQLEAETQTQVDTFQITEYQKTQILKAALFERYMDEVDAGEKATLAYAKFAADDAKITEQGTKKIMESWKSAADMIAGAFNSQLRGLLSGTTTFAQAVKNMFGDLVISIISAFVKMAAEWAAAQIAMLVVGKATLAEHVAQFLSTMQADAAMVFGGVFANLSPVMGPAAAGPATEAQASVLAIGTASTPKFDVGTPFVPRDMFAMIHKGEAIIPAASNPFTGGNTFAGGNTNLNMHINAIDGRSVAQMFMSNKGVMNELLRQIARENSGMFTRFAQSGSV